MTFCTAEYRCLTWSGNDLKSLLTMLRKALQLLLLLLISDTEAISLLIDAKQFVGNNSK